MNNVLAFILLLAALQGAFAGQDLRTDEGEGQALREDFKTEGGKLAFAAQKTKNSAYDLIVVDFTSGEVGRLTVRGSAEITPSFFPDGERLAFLSKWRGAYIIYLIFVETGQQERLNSITADETERRISPNAAG